ncbi:MAG: hypothetical protein HY364_02495 [Candidatus Aenigmarchaeota archaeon]|nr:hypothetical protein [Candidatus Aenigmarchaeota archaeon]
MEMNRVLLLALLLALMPAAAFAQGFQNIDIGELLFRDFLKMTEYPGAPFTGNIINDLVMFFFVPTAFIIIIVNLVAAKIVDQPKMILLADITLYLFIIFGGYFKIFAYIAQAYFLILIIVWGLLAYIISHFWVVRGRPGAAPPMGGGGGPAHMPGAAVASSMAAGEAGITIELLRGARTYNEQKTILSKAIAALNTQYNEARTEHNDRLAQSLQQQLSYMQGLHHLIEQQKRYDPTPSPVAV